MLSPAVGAGLTRPAAASSSSPYTLLPRGDPNAAAGHGRRGPKIKWSSPDYVQLNLWSGKAPGCQLPKIRRTNKPGGVLTVTELFQVT